MDLNDDHESDDGNGDGEGVWSPDIEQCFREALLLFPPCGRRKHILQEEGGGKMYGRNELIARHIMMRTGKVRTRKQVSSHIQVLARRKAKAEAASASGGVSISPSTIRSQSQSSTGQNDHHSAYYDVWVDRPIVTQKIRLVHFSAFIEYRNFQCMGVGNPTLSNNLSASLIQQPDSIGQDLSEGLQFTPGLLQSHRGSGQGHPAYQAAQQSTGSSPSVTNAHPLASNHQLPAQFNQATTYQTGNQLQPQLQKPHQQAQGQNADRNIIAGNQHHLIQQSQSSAGFIRHSYVQIDNSQTLGRQIDKLERIDISLIQDKFPEIGGSEGLFQRGPSDAFFLVKFWADINNDYEYNIDDQNSYFGFSSHFETIDPYKDITCSTKACSYGLQVVEKVEKIYGAFNNSNGRYSYNISRSPMCEFMTQFIKKLRQLPKTDQMNSVLENFTVLQVISSESTSEILLCLAYVFEIAPQDPLSARNDGPQYHVYKLTRD